jgi:sporulation protein YabP
MNRSEESVSVGNHTLYLQNRESLHLNGVEEVVSFDDTSVVLKTVLGALSVDGEELRVKKLDTERGEVTVEGRLCGMVYVDGISSDKRRASRSGKLFR